MKSYWMQSDGINADITLQETDRPVPGPGQMLIRVKAAGLNRGEFILGHGLHKVGSAKQFGLEASGEVVSCGEGVTDFKPGDRVMGRCPGAFAEYALLSAPETMHIPASLNWEQAAALPLTSLVVFDMLLVQGHLKPGEWVFITGVSSGVGVSALTMAKALGAKVIGTSGSQEKLDQLKALGLDVGICTREPNFYDAVMKATDGKGVDLVINAVGGSVFAECIRSMAFQGRLATVGYVDGVLKAEVDIEAMHAKRLNLFGVSNKFRTAAQRSAAMIEFKKLILPLIETGKIVPMVYQTLPFEKLLEAKEIMDSNQHLGKIVLAGTPEEA
ncbi:zinc-binding dehydrogenase [Polynucleobacter sp. AP-Melu-500A-A1]|uniref:zinc-binding dehydrogenase n=1 Tax=Polynucleobacter sp. AP-Melu-500A-A1 TaxID=2576929 RepID=UPI001C0D957B|nr:zinc-binding dehydrogenase [Polynucleobacter sp. AP-Melu-500A-A1]MBU3631431.1 zinc-binding dehydrogenase [Polynucleobacter sp. AP-Melu-500A-A1]